MKSFLQNVVRDQRAELADIHICLEIEGKLGSIAESKHKFAVDIQHTGRFHSEVLNF